MWPLLIGFAYWVKPFTFIIVQLGI